MADALIGHTGFVGSNLLRQRPFEHLFNSKNIAEIRGLEVDLLVCSGAPAEKWKANQDPSGDLATLQGLMGHLSEVRAKRVVLISTVDVFSPALEVDEASTIAPDPKNAYGRHRHQLEEFLRARFDTLVVRLPGLFGLGLKKNVIYDFLHGNRVEAVHSDGVFQFYDLENVWRDVETALSAGLKTIHFATEPVSVEALVRECFGREFVHRPHDRPARYDVRTRHADAYGRRGPYLYNRDEVLAAMSRFVGAARAGAK